MGFSNYRKRINRVNETVRLVRKGRGYSKWKFDYRLAHQVWRQEFQGFWWGVFYWVTLPLVPVIVLICLATAFLIFTILILASIIKWSSVTMGRLLTNKAFYGFLFLAAMIVGVLYYAGFAHK